MEFFKYLPWHSDFLEALYFQIELSENPSRIPIEKTDDLCLKSLTCMILLYFDIPRLRIFLNHPHIHSCKQIISYNNPAMFSRAGIQNGKIPKPSRLIMFREIHFLFMNFKACHEYILRKIKKFLHHT